MIPPGSTKNYLKATHVIPSFHAPVERHRRMKMPSSPPLWERIEVRGLTRILTFPHRGGRDWSSPPRWLKRVCIIRRS